ncbi:DUF262 domain-containing protein [Mucilaginibacter celer]|uniref:DUF262 domain-containing protein n=1 Tax=Mucilaginibacter celer TaxID=2305508 RepID=A0A494VMR0_9SPHI|nr:DUF262 domain-containing protein [Mucilaginibacter celer]AYL94250.1 DUF262 domain-containing protein [Mucilaginibacter celer]
MSESNLRLRPVNDLLKDSFIVPDYQRGYRWTPKEVTALLNDIWSFFTENQNSRKEVYYCLQPLVVIEDDGKWILVDGQQRLTTIYLILTYLKDGLLFLGKTKYTLSYDTRPGSEAFLKQLNEAEKNDNIDYFHMWEAYNAIGKWFDGQDGSVRYALLNTLLSNDEVGKNVKFIWYEIDPAEAVSIFTRINMGKIPLTNAELIKALFLRKDNFSEKERQHIYARQLEIASEWDRMENTLQKDPFWYFIHDNSTKYDTRIEFIFDLLKGKMAKHDDYHTFIEFSKDFENQGIGPIWMTVKRYFMTLEEWYNDRVLFHYIGFLIITGSKISDLFDQSGKLTKSAFKDFLKDKIREKLDLGDLEEITYSHTGKVRNVLLLHNIETILQNEGSNVRFQFDEFKKQSWDIEHISSVASEMPSSGKSRRWMENVRDYFTGNTVFDHYEKGSPEINEIVNQLINLLQKESYSDKEFESLYHRVIGYFKEGDQSESSSGSSLTHSIANLTLLDSSTNRSYQNAVFPVKRKQILKNDIGGLFVPVCTKNVFLKYYSDELNDVMFWQKSDASAYLANMNEVLDYYL